jgi:NAD(P)-dependent dehydrogenase (short-subunit alcohol dehydrogenase family)
MVSAPFVSPYSSSKFALEALTDSLRMELHPWHIEVSSIQPGAIDTPIWNKAENVLQGLVQEVPPQGLKLYGDAITGMEPRYERHGISTDAVAAAVAHALASPHPKTRYPIATEGAIVRLFRWLPDRLRDRIMLSQLPKWGVM